MTAVRITVAKRTLHAELAAAHARGPVAPCEVFQEGQSFLSTWAKPEGFCDWAWNDINKPVISLLTGGSFSSGLFDGWMRAEGSMMACCTDGFRPVSFLLERVDTLDLIDLAGVRDPAPREVYATERWGEFSYEFAGLAPGAPLTARLHFAETVHSAEGRRVFHLDANGARAVEGLDILAAAGGGFRPHVIELPLKADAAGRLRLDFVKGPADYPKASAIELLDAAGKRLAAVNCGGPAAGAFEADRGFSGGSAAGG
jgi:uncharacterized repeat protein (TIGR04076 family)